MSRKPVGTGTKGTNSNFVWIIGIIVAVVALSNMSKCSSPGAKPTASEIAVSDPTIKTLTASVAEQKPAPVEPLSGAGTKGGVADMRKAVTAEGLSGAMIYSQNCYDALSHGFTWRKLDVCGAADLKAVASVPEDEVAGLEKELAYFQSETAAGRYLGAATGAGISADDADQRLASMQQRIPMAHPSPHATDTSEISADAQADVGDPAGNQSFDNDGL